MKSVTFKLSLVILAIGIFKVSNAQQRIEVLSLKPTTYSKQNRPSTNSDRRTDFVGLSLPVSPRRFNVTNSEPHFYFPKVEKVGNTGRDTYYGFHHRDTYAVYTSVATDQLLNNIKAKIKADSLSLSNYTKMIFSELTTARDILKKELIIEIQKQRIVQIKEELKKEIISEIEDPESEFRKEILDEIKKKYKLVPLDN